MIVAVVVALGMRMVVTLVRSVLVSAARSMHMLVLVRVIVAMIMAVIVMIVTGFAMFVSVIMAGFAMVVVTVIVPSARRGRGLPRDQADYQAGEY